MKKNRKMLCVTAAVAAFAAVEGLGFEARLSSVAIEEGARNQWVEDARAELERHLALVDGGGFSPAKGKAELTIVLGRKATGEGEPESHTSYAKLVGDRLYLWGDDERCPGTGAPRSACIRSRLSTGGSGRSRRSSGSCIPRWATKAEAAAHGNRTICIRNTKGGIK